MENPQGDPRSPLTPTYDNIAIIELRPSNGLGIEKPKAAGPPSINPKSIFVLQLALHS